MPVLEPDNNTPAIITDHPYRPRNEEEPWGLCLCGLAEAAHSTSASPYIPTSEKATQECSAQSANQ
jgi:hypothetical protein